MKTTLLLVTIGLAACGGASKSSSSCDQYLACLESTTGDDPAYEAAKAEYGAGGNCDVDAETRAACDQACTAALNEYESTGVSCSGTSQGPGQSGTDGGTKSTAACMLDQVCADDSDCQSGQRCNTALAKPSCQILYCGATGTACGGSDPSALCASKTCSVISSTCVVPEAVPDMGTLLTCGEILSCDEACTSGDSCVDACISSGTPTAQSDFTTLFTCISSACASATNVEQCFAMATSSGGLCYADYSECMLDQT